MKGPMRIVHIINTQGVSGAEKYLDYLLPGLKAHNINCDLLLVCPAASKEKLEPFAAMIRDKGIPTTIITGNRLSMLSTVRKINAYCKKNDISIIHSHLLNTDILVCLLKQFYRRKYYIISTKHGYDEKVLNVYTPDKYRVKRDLYYYITRYTLSRIDKNVTISKGMADLFTNLKISDTSFPVIHHGIDVKRNENAEASSFRLAKQQLIITGRLETMKGHKYLLAAMPLILKVYPDCKLLILGEGSLKEQLKEMVCNLGIENSVDFLGFKTDPYSYIQYSDVVVLPSLFEPFGLVYIEAQALKTPVVAFDSPAANELIIDEETGLLAMRGDSKGLADRILLLLSDKNVSLKITEQAYSRYIEKFTSAIMISKTADWYKSLNIGR